MKLTSMLLAVVLLSANVDAGVDVTPRNDGRLDVVAENATLRSVFEVIALRGGIGVRYEAADRVVSAFRLTGVTADDAVKRLAAREGLRVVKREGVLVVRNSEEPTLSIDVKDAPIRQIVSEVRQQCGIRNIMIDPGVEASGTFLMKDVPCSVALRTIFQSLGVSAEVYPNSVLRVEKSK
jgi:hypothetical protein